MNGAIIQTLDLSGYRKAEKKRDPRLTERAGGRELVNSCAGPVGAGRARDGLALMSIAGKARSHSVLYLRCDA